MKAESMLGVVVLAAAVAAASACGGDEGEGDGTGGGGDATSGTTTSATTSTSASTTTSTTTTSITGAGGGAEGGGGAGQGGGGEGGGTGADWSCVGNVVWPEPQAATVSVTLGLIELQSAEALVGVAVKACAKDDDACAAPLAEATTDEEGTLTVELPAGTDGFDGHFEFASDDIVPTLNYPARPFTEDSSLIVTVLSTTTWAQLSAVIQAPPDPERGHLTFFANDCEVYNAAAGVSVSIDTADENSVTAYVVGVLPSTEATETTDTGLGGIVNVPPGPAVVTGKRADTGEVIGKRSILIRAGYITSTNVLPTP